jgi:hypothetical protein
MIRSLSLLSVASIMLLTACDHNMLVTPMAAEPDIVTVKLAMAADKAAKALDTIAGIEQTRSPTTSPMEDYSNVPPNLMKPVSLKWSGPIEQVTRALAEHAGLRFRTKGNIPPIPLTVNVDAYQQPIMHILHDIGMQSGHRADVGVDGKEGVVELRYAPADLPESHHASRPVVHADETK